MSTFSIPMTDDVSIVPSGDEKPSLLEIAGQAANRAAVQDVFDDYRLEKSENTLRAHDRNLGLFTGWLNAQSAKGGLPPIVTGDLSYDADAWRGVTFGLVSKFRKHLLNEGFAIASINLMLTSIRVFSGLAFDAGTIPEGEHLRIRRVKGYSKGASVEVNNKRNATRRDGGPGTGKPAKKAESVMLGDTDRDRLRRFEADGGIHPDTPQGRRDALLMCILLDLGLRCSEVADLKVGNFDLEAGQVTFYRKKVKLTQTHEFHKFPTLQDAIRRYFAHDALTDPEAPLLRSSLKNGELNGGHMKERAINARVRYFGKLIGRPKLSPHDCRHTWTTVAAAKNTPLDRLMHAGGWNSYAMPLRYIEAAKIANEGVKLS